MLKQLQARLGEVTKSLTALLAKESLTAEEIKQLDALQKEVDGEKDADGKVTIEGLEAQITRLKKAQDLIARGAKPADTPADATRDALDPQDPADGRVPAAPEQKMEPDQKLSIIAAATLKAKVGRSSVLKVLADNGYAAFAKQISDEMKRRTVDTDVASALIPTTLSNQIIELLRPETTFFQGNPKRVQFTHGKFKAPRGASGAVASYVGEAAKKPVTGPTFDSIEMSAKKLAGIVLITQEARDWSLPNLEAYIRDDLRAAMGQATDTAAYFGTGSGSSPTGILNVSGVPSFDAADYFANPLAPTITEIDTMASRLVLSLTLANIGASSTWAWLMNYRTLEYLKNLRVGDTTGVYAYPELRGATPTFKGFRVLVSNQVPINLGSGTDESILALIDFRHVLYGEEEGIVVKTSDEATVDVNGTLVLLWQQNMYGILTETQHDFGLRHTRAAAKLTGLRAGADTTESP